MLKPVILATLLSVSLFAQNNNSQNGAGANGAEPYGNPGRTQALLWSIQTHPGKIAWLEGYDAGLACGATSIFISIQSKLPKGSAAAARDDVFSRYWLPDASFGEVADALDRFYSDSENTFIDFPEVMARLIHALALNTNAPDLSSSSSLPDGRYWTLLNEKRSWLEGMESALMSVYLK